MSTHVLPWGHPCPCPSWCPSRWEPPGQPSEAAHRLERIQQLLCHAGLLHLHLSDLFTELLALSLELGEGHGGVSPA